ncbi:hypothetical protein KLP28_06825 [Nocardioidaceae bacterium]|nr:hypothetical protein KLP28_06825 [Nocardioidaceae bacterium]
MKHEDEPTPHGSTPSENEVRALLQSLRVESPVPPELGARLEETVTSLQAEGSRTPARTERARRARPARVALALAAGVAVAVGAGGLVLPLLDGVSGGDPAASTAADAAGGAESAQQSGALEPTPRQDLPRLSRADFALQVQRELQAQRSTARALSGLAASETSEAPEARETPQAAAAADEAPPPMQDGVPDATRPAATCDAGVAPGPRQRSFLATLDDRRVLVVAGSARAVAYACAEDGGLRLTSRPEAILSRPLD